MFLVNKRSDSPKSTEERNYLVHHKPTTQTHRVKGYLGLVDLGISEKDLPSDAISMYKCTIGNYVITEVK